MKFLIRNVYGAVWLDTRRPKVRGELHLYPVKARITHKRIRYYIGLGFDLTKEDFDQLERSKRRELVATRKQIAASFEHIKMQVDEICSNEEYTHDKLRHRLQRGRKEFVDVAFDNRIAELTINGQVGTAATYRNAKRFIQRYKSDLRFRDITPQWLQNFEKWALNEGVTETTLGIYLRPLRALFNNSIRLKEIPRSIYPFVSAITEGYTIPPGKGTKIALTVDQMNAIAQLELAGSIEHYRDIFLLSFHMGGINIKDLLLLKWKNIKGDELHFVREKTKRTNKVTKTIEMPYTESSRQIIDRWGNPDTSPDAYIIPHLTDDLTPEQIMASVKSYTKLMNNQLKKIGTMVGIEGLTTYVARHSFATILKNSGAPVAFISEMLGHASTKTTEDYLKSFEKEQKRKHYDLLKDVGKINR